MALPIERWAKQAVLLERKIGEIGPLEAARPVASMDVLQDVEQLARLQKQTWKRRMVEIAQSGAPVMMPEGTYGGLLNYPPAATITTTSISGTVNLWPQANYSAFPANMYLMPQAYRVVVVAKITTVATPGNFGLDPRIGQGTWTTGGTAITGTTLGASGNVALTASITNAFYYVIGDLTVRSGGAPGGNNYTAVGMFHLNSTQNTAAGVAGPAPATAAYSLLFGGTNAAFDGAGAAQGFGLGAVHTVTTITHNVEQIHCMDWN